MNGFEPINEKSCPLLWLFFNTLQFSYFSEILSLAVRKERRGKSMKSGGAAKSAKPYEFASVVQWNSKESVSKIQIGIFYEI